jgi:hypothetical protein
MWTLYLRQFKWERKELEMFRRIGIGLLVAATLVLGIAGAALAQGPTPPSDDLCPFGGGCGGFGMGGHGMMGGFGYHGTMPSILADVLGLTVDELYEALADGKTVAELAQQQGVELADVVAAVIAPRVEQLQQAVAEGYLTQEQADWMIDEMTEHMTWRFENFGLSYGGYGSGGCGMMGGGSFGRQGGWRGHGMGGGRWGGSSNTPRFPTWSSPSSGL